MNAGWIAVVFWVGSRNPFCGRGWIEAVAQGDGFAMEAPGSEVLRND